MLWCAWRARQVETFNSAQVWRAEGGRGKKKKQGCWEGVVLWITSLKIHSPESPWDIIIFLPSLSWTWTGWVFVGWSESKRSSVFISHVFYWLHVCAGIQLWRGCLLVERPPLFPLCAVRIELKYMGLVEEVSVYVSTVNVIQHWSGWLFLVLSEC